MTKPLAFMSYAHVDDTDGNLTEFRQRLSTETQILTGNEFPIFQDRDNIRWGENWKDRIEKSIDQVTFLIPIVTPSFFKSENCRGELQRFLKHEKDLGRNDLILPIYYVDSSVLNEESLRQTDELAQAIHSHHYADWRELRHEPLTNPEVRRNLARLARQIAEALVHEAEPPEEVDGEASPTPRETQQSNTAVVSAAAAANSGSAAGLGESSSLPISKNEPQIRVVDPRRVGDHATISDAIEAAAPGERILVRPGLYKEGLVVDKSLEIVGQGDVGSIIVQAKGSPALLFKTSLGRVNNLTFRQAGGKGQWFGVDIGQGHLELEGCDVSSDSLSCVGIHSGADPILRRNRIHDGKQGGVFVFKGGKGTLEDNDIFNNAYAGVNIKEGSDPTLRNNRIRGGKQGGVYVHEGAKGTLEGNEIFGNRQTGVEVRGAGSDPTLRNNRVNKNGYEAVWVCNSGGGTFEGNDLTDNGRGAWDIAADSASNVKQDSNQE